MTPRPDSSAFSARSIDCPNAAPGKQCTLDEALLRAAAEEYVQGREAVIRQQERTDARASFEREIEDVRNKREALEATLKDRDQRLKESREREVKLLRERSELEDEKADLERKREQDKAEIRKQERKDAEARAKERIEAEQLQKDADNEEKLRRVSEDYEVQLRTKEAQLKRVSNQLKQAQRNADTRSWQEEGVAAADLFGDELARRFPDDEVTKIPRGNAGVDVNEVVRVGNRRCGPILWECKRAAKWGGTVWETKLAGDCRKENATIGIIVSRKLPAGMEGVGRLGDNLWACDYDHAWALAEGLRQGVIVVSWYETANANRASAEGRVYDWLATSGEFEAMYKGHEQAVDSLTAFIDKLEELAATLTGIRNALRALGPRGQTLALMRLGAEVPPGVRAELSNGDHLKLPPA